MLRKDLIVGNVYILTANKKEADEPNVYYSFVEKFTEVIFKGEKFLDGVWYMLEFEKKDGSTVYFDNASHLQPVSVSNSREVIAQHYDKVLDKINKKIKDSENTLSTLKEDKKAVEEQIAILRKFKTDEEEIEFKLGQIINNAELTEKDKKEYLLGLINKTRENNVIIKKYN